MVDILWLLPTTHRKPAKSALFGRCYDAARADLLTFLNTFGDLKKGTNARFNECVTWWELAYHYKAEEGRADA